MLDVPLLEQKANWEALYPRVLLDAVEGLRRGSWQTNGKIGICRFLVWLAGSGNAADARVRARFWGPRDESGVALFATEIEHARLFENALCRWRDEFLQQSDLKLTSRTSYIRAAVAGLRSLVVGHYIDGIPTSINGGWAPTKTVYGAPTRSLGAANLLGLDTTDQNILTGPENERASKDAVRAAFLEEFLLWENIFDFGQRALSGAAPPEGADPSAYDEFVRYLRKAVPRHRTSGVRKDDAEYQRLRLKVPSLTQSYQKFLGDVANIDIGARYITVDALLRGCFGPTRRCTAAVFGVALCDIGWNVQPLVDLPRNPFVFGGSRGTVVAGDEIIESFKIRANHHVFSYIGERTVSAGAQDILEGLLKEVVPDFDPSGVGDGYARLPNSNDPNSTLNILDRYVRMADVLRDTTDKKTDKLLRDRFWVFFGKRGPSVFSNTNATTVQFQRIFNDHPLLSMPGVLPKTIRKTFINLCKRESGSFGLAQAAAQHNNSTTLMPHYLNTPAENARLDESIRLFQASVQAIAVRELDQERVALVLEQEPALLERMRHMAAEAGIAHAFGLYPDPPEEKASAPRIEFLPCAENLLELYLVRRKLREMRISFNHERFRREFLPFIALTIVIVRELLKKGCRPAYRAAVMRACGMLRNKEITLPALED